MEPSIRYGREFAGAGASGHNFESTGLECRYSVAQLGRAGQDGSEVRLWREPQLHVDICKTQIAIKEKNTSTLAGEGVS